MVLIWNWFKPKKTVSIPYDFRKKVNYLLQLWFKKLGDKIFMFKLVDKTVIII